MGGDYARGHKEATGGIIAKVRGYLTINSTTNTGSEGVLIITRADGSSNREHASKGTSHEKHDEVKVCRFGPEERHKRFLRACNHGQISGRR